MTNRTSEEAFDELHRLVTTELVSRLKSGEATTQDIRAAADWLAKNQITGVAVSGSPLAALLQALPEISEEEVERVIR